MKIHQVPFASTTALTKIVNFSENEALVDAAWDELGRRDRDESRISPPMDTREQDARAASEERLAQLASEY